MDNSASLLLKILEDARAKKKETISSEVWRDLLDAPNPVSLVGVLGEFLTLTEKAALDVLSVHDDLSGVNYWRTRVLNGFHTTALGQPWAGFRGQIDDITIFTLRSHAKILEMHRPQRGLNDQEISQSRDLFASASEALRDANLDSQVKRILLIRIEQIESLLNRYKFTGPDSVLDASKILAAEVGSVPREQAEEIRRSGAYSKIKEGLEILANATQVASSSPVLIASTSYLLGLMK